MLSFRAGFLNHCAAIATASSKPTLKAPNGFTAGSEPLMFPAHTYHFSFKDPSLLTALAVAVAALIDLKLQPR